MKRSAGVAVLVVLAVSMGHARAETRPAWSDIPTGSIPLPPDHSAAPRNVDASEHVAGLSVERDARSAFSTTRRRVTVSGRDRLCLTGNVDFSSESDPAEHQLTTDLRLPVVTAVRTERIVLAADGKASLEIADVWIDPQTLGSRELSRTAIPLARIGRAPNGAGIYAFRQGEQLSLVVPTPGRSGIRGSDGQVSVADCQSARVSVGAPDPGGSALVSTPLELPTTAGASRRAGVMDVNLSVSRLSRDPAPVVSIAVTWAEDEPTPDRAFAR